jgi:DNA-directed RNA polymerase specialized sigma24 family protein
VVVYPLLQDREKLLEMASQYSDAEIAKMMGATRSTVTYARHRLGVPPRIPPCRDMYPELKNDAWVKDHNHMSHREVAELLGCSIESVERARRRVRRSERRRV